MQNYQCAYKNTQNNNKQKNIKTHSRSLNKGGNFMHYKDACSTMDKL